MFLRWNTLNMTLRSSLMVENQRYTDCPLLVVSECLKDFTTYLRALSKTDSGTQILA